MRVCGPSQAPVAPPRAPLVVPRRSLLLLPPLGVLALTGAPAPARAESRLEQAFRLAFEASGNYEKSIEAW
jgi:hypothetical protein